MKRTMVLCTLVFLVSMSIYTDERNSMNKINSVRKNQVEVGRRLNILLANEYVLLTKTLKYHWNVVGGHFGPLHALFNEQYEQLFKFIDEIAERARALQVIAFGTLKEFMDHATIEESPGKNPDAYGMIADLLADYEVIIAQIKKDIDFTVQAQDPGTNNFLSDLVEKHEKTAWMLRAHLE